MCFWPNSLLNWSLKLPSFLPSNKEYVNEMESVESSLKQMGENVSALQATALPGLARWGQDSLDRCQSRWALLSKQVRKKLFLSRSCVV